MDIKTITLIGHGNVGSHLYKAFSAVGINVLWRHSDDVLEAGSDAYVVSVTDTATPAVCRRAMAVAGSAVVVHTAGSIGIEVFGGKSGCGVFYPMQTFSKERDVDMSKVAVFVEATDTDTLRTIQTLGECVSSRVAPLSSEQRKRLHIAAVFACNFVNHCMTLSDSILQTVGLDYTVMLPLLDETVGKLHCMSPRDAQTGPAARGDTAVTAMHESMIDNRLSRAVYHAMTESILSV